MFCTICSFRRKFSPVVFLVALTVVSAATWPALCYLQCVQYFWLCWLRHSTRLYIYLSRSICINARTKIEAEARTLAVTIAVFIMRYPSKNIPFLVRYFINANSQTLLCLGIDFSKTLQQVTKQMRGKLWRKENINNNRYLYLTV